MVRLASGKVALVGGVLPGELVEIADAERAPRLVRVVEPGAERVSPVCPWADRCGGCDWMHLAGAAQPREHARLVRDLLTHALRTGSTREGLPEIVVHPATTALGYRSRARLALRGDGRRVEVGYRAAASRDIVEIETCAVLDAAIAPLLGELGEVLAGSSGRGEANVARGAGGRPVVDVRWHGELAATAWAAFDGRVAAGAWAGVRVTLEGVSRPAVYGDPRGVSAGADGAPLLAPPGGFAQASDEAFNEIARRVGEIVAAASPRTVLELFAGSGALSVVVAQTAPFSAVEIDADAAACLRDNLAARGLSGHVTVADANAFAIPRAADAIVLDPPRTGAPGAARALAASRARCIVYVSCDPPTLARDLATLQAGYELTGLETFELFPQTSHVETLAVLARRPVSPSRHTR